MATCCCCCCFVVVVLLLFLGGGGLVGGGGVFVYRRFLFYSGKAGRHVSVAGCYGDMSVDTE